MQCVDASDCPINPPGQCAGCETNADCSGATPCCHPQKYRCVACVSNADCGPTGVCNQSYTCDYPPP